MPTLRQQRSLRAGAAASLATFVALLSHVVAGGSRPSALGILLPWALALLIALAVVGRRLSFARLGAAVAGAQSAFHAMFALGVVPSAGSAWDTPGGSGSHAAHGLLAGHMSLPASVSPLDTVAAAVPDGAMLGAHALAAVATTFLLHRGERVLGLLGELARRLAIRVRAVACEIMPPAHTPIGARLIPADLGVRRRRPLVAGPARRGPPVLLAL